MVQLLHGSDEAQMHAAAAVWSILKGGPADRAAVVAAGAIPALVHVLRTCSSHDVLTIAANCICNLVWVKDAGANIAEAVQEAGGIDALVWLMGAAGSGGGATLQVTAAGALHNLACSSLPRKAAITAAGGVHTAVQLLRSTRDADAMRSAAGLLAIMADDARDPTQQAFAEAGGVAALVQLLRTSYPAEALDDAAAALAALAARRPAHRQAIAAADGIPTLVRLLAAGIAQLQTINALRPLILDGPYQPPALVSCLRSSHEEVQTQASAALANLMHGSLEHQQAVAAAGAIPPLAVLALQQHNSVALQSSVASALQLVAMGSPESAAAVAQALGAPGHLAAVELLVCSAVPALAYDVPQLQEAFRAVGVALTPPGTTGLTAIAAVAGLSSREAGVRERAAEGCCNTRGLRRCSACGSELYCSSRCQAAHWPAHRAECRRRRRAAAAVAPAPGH